MRPPLSAVYPNVNDVQVSCKEDAVTVSKLLFPIEITGRDWSIHVSITSSSAIAELLVIRRNQFVISFVISCDARVTSIRKIAKWNF